MKPRRKRKTATAKRTRQQNEQIIEDIQGILAEVDMNIFELAGRFLANCQLIELKLKSYIARLHQRYTMEKLEKKTLGQLLQLFRPISPDAELNEWLTPLLELRNDAAHIFFLFNADMRKQFGDDIERLNAKLMRKGIRMTEFCLARLDKLLKTV